jgi:hypothetical protein
LREVKALTLLRQTATRWRQGCQPYAPGLSHNSTKGSEKNHEKHKSLGYISFSAEIPTRKLPSERKRNNAKLAYSARFDTSKQYRALHDLRTLAEVGTV